MAPRRRLDAELVRRQLVGSRTEAQSLIGEHRVLVNGSVADKASRQVSPADAVIVDAPPARFVGRGGEKLEHALSVFTVDVRGLRGLDAGASTGGFTDCLLQRGAAHVVAVDVGEGQLDWRLRNDPRVTVREGVNARMLEPAQVGEPPTLVVADVAFISLAKVLPAIRDCAPDA